MPEVEVRILSEPPIQIDYDDVDHPQVDKDARKLVKILNEHWND